MSSSSQTEVAIRVEGISKLYRLDGSQERYRTLRDTLSDSVTAPFTWALRAFKRKSEVGQVDLLWALRDISFEVKRGEVLGIIGRNGAGKSTLLKVLSRITDPTTGRADVYGRIGCLLEVGSGFHPELTGRENVYLNGAILGMKRAEIDRNFDEIVAFAEVERFIDTPVKRYSSGMYLRLAFSVAAHLEPEILIIDEVLAVGDFDFQKKCLGKMKDVAGSGRTVLFVSHNMGAVQQLCDRAVLLDRGRVEVDAPVRETVGEYLRIGLDQSGERIWRDASNAPMLADVVRLSAIRVLDAGGSVRSLFNVREPLFIETEYEVLREQYSLNVHLYFHNETGQTLFVTMDNLHSPWRDSVQPVGTYRATCRVPPDFLNEGSVRVEYLICTRPTTQHYVTFPDAVSFQMTDDREPDGVRGNWTRDWPDAMVRPRLEWDVRQLR